MTSPAALRGERRRSRNRAALLDAAETLFAGRPFASVRIEDIAEGADMSVGAVYMHFETKDGVLTAVAERVVQRVVEKLAAAFDPSLSPYDQLATSGTVYMQSLLANPVFVRFLATEPTSRESHVVQKSASGTVSALLALFEASIQACIDNEQIRPVDARLMAHFLFGAWNGVAALTLGPSGATLTAAEVEQCLEQARNIVLAGLTTTPAPTEGIE